MTDKQKEAIEYFKKRIDICMENANICDDNDFDEEATCLRKEQILTETVVNLIQTQQAEIDSLKDFKEIAESKVTDLNPIGLARTNQLLSRQCHKLQEESEKKDIDIIEAKEANRQLSVELQNKDKIIKELEEKLSERNMEKH